MALRVLLIEDSEDDAALLLAELRLAGYEVFCERVENAAGMTAALETAAWDIVLSDYSLPHFSAPAALKVLQEKGHDLPFIIVSGAIGEVTAIAAMKLGAHDFIMKGNLRRLGAVMERELREAQVRRDRRNAEETVRLQQQRLAALHDINLAATSTLNLETVLNVLLEKIDTLLPYAAATIRLFNPQSGELEPVACRNIDEQRWRSGTRGRGRGLTGVVFQTKEPLIVRDAREDPRTLYVDHLRREGLLSYLGMPLLAKEKAIGVLSFYTREEHEFNDEEVSFVATFAGQAAAAIHNSQLYEQTKNQAAELQRANKVKDEFLSVMSHELRTPLSVIMGYTGMIKDRVLGEINPKQEETLGKVICRSEDLLSMLSGILQATSIEAGETRLEPHEVNLGFFLTTLRSSYDRTLAKTLTLNWDYPPDLPVVKTDSEKLKHILQNLVNNAVKFTDEGAITISARYVPQAKAVEFKVTDTGIGIPRESFPMIFEKFRQVDSSETRSYGGVGLGLYIVKNFTELLGGTLAVESAPGVGSTFTVTIPTAPTPAPHGC